MFQQKQKSSSMYSSFSSTDSLSSANKSSISNEIFKAILDDNIYELNRIFIQNNKNVNVFNRTNKLLITPLIFAISLNRIECMKTLLDIGVNINKPDGLQNTPLHVACIDGNYEITKLLLQDGRINKHTFNEFKECPLLTACASNNKPCVKLLIDTGSYLYNRDHKGNNAIHIVCEYGNIDIVMLLLEKCVSINCRNLDGKTPLYIACIEKQLECVQFLIDNDADINIPDSIGRTPLQSCYDSKVKQILRRKT
jgi:ankyrin repeat protein